MDWRAMDTPGDWLQEDRGQDEKGELPEQLLILSETIGFMSRQAHT
jgi:hypothetical protein